VKTITATYSGDSNFVGSAATTTHTVNLTIAGNIKLAPAGTNLAGVTVSLTGTNAPAATTTDANGNYSFSGIFTGNYTVTPSGLGNGYDPISRTFTNVLASIPNADFTAYAGSVPRVISVPNSFATPGQPAVVAVNVSSLGNEKTFSFKVT
jgi:hypothetical protein